MFSFLSSFFLVAAPIPVKLFRNIISIFKQFLFTLSLSNQKLHFSKLRNVILFVKSKCTICYFIVFFFVFFIVAKTNIVGMSSVCVFCIVEAKIENWKLFIRTGLRCYSEKPLTSSTWIYQSANVPVFFSFHRKFQIECGLSFVQ